MLRQNNSSFFFFFIKLTVIFDSSNAGWSVGGIILESPAAFRLGLEGFILLCEIYIQAVA